MACVADGTKEGLKKKGLFKWAYLRDYPQAKKVKQ